MAVTLLPPVVVSLAVMLPMTGEVTNQPFWPSGAGEVSQRRGRCLKTSTVSAKFSRGTSTPSRLPGGRRRCRAIGPRSKNSFDISTPLTTTCAASAKCGGPIWKAGFVISRGGKTAEARRPATISSTGHARRKRRGTH